MREDNGVGAENRLKPLVKWAGGKSQLLGQYSSLFPVCFNTYHEIMAGGLAVFWHLAPRLTGAHISDNNPELINFYCTVRDQPEELFTSLARHRNEKKYYYTMRSLDPASLSPLERASRFLYLNKAGYNGLWRVNSRGVHNVPFGRYSRLSFPSLPDLLAASHYLKKTHIRQADFASVLDYARQGDFVYIDPPYHPLSASASFTAYSGSFGEEEQARLAEICRELDARGVQFMLSNSDTALIKILYRGFDLQQVTARRAINSKGDGRGSVKELVVRNYC